MTPHQLRLTLVVKLKQEKLSWRELSRLTGVPTSTLFNICKGRIPTYENHAKIEAWLEPKEKQDTLSIINQAIFADGKLRDADKEKLSRVITRFYEAVTK